MRFNVLLAALSLCAGPSVAQTNTGSPPEDKRRFVDIVHRLERDPLNAGLQADRQWAMQWLRDAPDVSINVCLDPLGGVDKANYAYAPEIVVQYMFSMAAFVIQHPEKKNDPDGQQMVGVGAALNAYRSILRDRPTAKSARLDKLMTMQIRGELPAFVQKAYAHCSAGRR
jgi:hypothetical protein